MVRSLFWPLAVFSLASPFVRAAPTELTNVTVFTPPSDYTDPRVLYARAVQLPNNDLLATWENYSPEPPPVYFPIYRSTDSGATWAEVARVQDVALGVGLRYQPQLYVLPEALYASADAGLTWEFVSHVAGGGRAVPDNGLTPVWEPFLLAREGRLIYYYSDQRENATYGQKLVHQTSADLRVWDTALVDDVAYPTYTDRPGMPTVARLPNGQYIYVYEYGGGPNPATTDGSYSFPMFYRLSADPEAFMQAEHHPLVTTGGDVPTGSPYVVWSPAGGEDGTIIVSSGCCSEVYMNRALGAEDAWEKVATPAGSSYTRSLMVFQEDPSYVLIAGAGKLPPSTTNTVQISVIKV
ncbi:BNR/Asp-box repeat protein [Apiospora phragmitis]|uniref:BNR/Asp-box repeat protein n=1 Tax=Apiospora phragmitis TaxID=2905665 RepID=A0ABR1TTA9_9PEZI